MYIFCLRMQTYIYISLTYVYILWVNFTISFYWKYIYFLNDMVKFTHDIYAYIFHNYFGCMSATCRQIWVDCVGFYTLFFSSMKRKTSIGNEVLASLGTMGAQLRTHLKPFNTIVLWWSEGCQGPTMIPMMPRERRQISRTAVRLIGVFLQSAQNLGTMEQRRGGIIAAS